MWRTNGISYDKENRYRETILILEEGGNMNLIERLFNQVDELKVNKEVKEQIVASYNTIWNKTFFKSLD